jgi:DNA relaxase NicK
VYCGVDWISGTLGREEIANQTWLYDNLHALETVALMGNTYKRRSLLGFDGWESGGCFLGSNETTHYVQFAGKYANDAYDMLEHPKVHISRIDLQITVKYDTSLPKEGRYQYARAVHHNKGLPTHRQRKIDTYFGSSGGDTIYLGSPSSDTRGRLYNKEKQSNDAGYERSWRYEVVYRNKMANSVFRRLFDKDTTPSEFILQEVISWYHERGVDILGLVFGEFHATERPKEAKTDVKRKLIWIEKQVIPTIRKLASMGYAEELMTLIAEAIAAARNEQL